VFIISGWNIQIGYGLRIFFGEWEKNDEILKDKINRDRQDRQDERLRSKPNPRKNDEMLMKLFR